MSLDQRHPELASEQAYIDDAHRLMDAMFRQVSRFGPHGRNDFEREAFERWKATRRTALRDRFSPLVFGRIDRAEGATYYIGRQHVYDDGLEPAVIDWRAPVAKAFYRADARDPMGLRRRRHFLLDGRALLGISDDHLEAPAGGGPALRGADILRVEIERQRTGRMRDIVATIQAEQDLIIRAPLAGIVVVQGGPGTGKTAIGLHRASFLLYEHREELTRRRVLVVGPNPVFMRYISQVLPSLGETAAVQRTIDELAPLVRATRRDDPAVARLKGDARMAAVIARALAERMRPPVGDLVVQVHGALLRMTGPRLAEEVARLRGRGVPHAPGRAMLRDALLLALYRSYQRRLREGSTPAPFEEVTAQIRRDPAFRRALDAAWPAVGPEALVRSVLRTRQSLARAADGVLSPDEQRLLVRARGAWSEADRALLDEARALVEGPPERYGHVVVDEAQDLSPMRLRMLARRSREGSMTVLGDLGQATGPWAHDDWAEVLAHLPAPHGARTVELTLGYRVAPAIMEVAAAILAEAAPRLRAPTAVRAEPGEVTVVRVAPDAMAARAAAAARALADAEGSAAIIAPDALEDAIERALAESGARFGEAERDGLENPVTLLAASMAKGLEFDALVLVEPAAIVDQGGPRLLYIAVTRAMRSLAVVHARALPDPLARGLAPRAVPA